MGPGMDGKGEKPRDVAPAPPAWPFLQKIGAHQPDEARARKPKLQGEHGIAGKAGAEPRLDPGRDDAAAIGDGAGGFEAGGERRHAGPRLERIARRDQEPDLVEAQGAAEPRGDQAMAGMGGVEGAAQEPDTAPPPVAEARQFGRRRLAPALRGGSGHCLQRRSGNW